MLIFAYFSPRSERLLRSISIFERLYSTPAARQLQKQSYRKVAWPSQWPIATLHHPRGTTHSQPTLTNHRPSAAFGQCTWLAGTAGASWQNENNWAEARGLCSARFIKPVVWRPTSWFSTAHPRGKTVFTAAKVVSWMNTFASMISFLCSRLVSLPTVKLPYIIAT